MCSNCCIYIETSSKQEVTKKYWDIFPPVLKLQYLTFELLILTLTETLLLVLVYVTK